MFCILKSENRKKSLFKKNEPFSVKRTVIPDKAVFDEITLYYYRGKADWQALRRRIGGLYGATLFSDGFIPEKGSRIFEYKSERLRSFMKMNTAVEILEKSKKSPQSLSVAVIDRAGEYQSCVEKVIRCAAGITVMTENTEGYSLFAEKMLMKYGAAIRLFPPSDAKFSADLTVNLSSPSQADFLFSRPTGSIKMNGGSFTVPDLYRQYLPDGVDGYAFLSALFSLCFVTELCGMKFRSLILGGREISLETLDTEGIF